MLSVKVRMSSVIDASVDQVWATIQDFNDLPKWYSSVISSHIENGDTNTIGCIRQYERKDGLTIREQLLGLNDLEHTCSYSLLEPSEPMKDYVATMRLLPITDGDRTYIEWFADFTCLPEQGETLRSAIKQVFQVGFDGLRAILNP